MDIADAPSMFDRLAAALDAEIGRATFRVGQIFLRESVANAPRSPTMAQIKRDRKRREENGMKKKLSAKQKAFYKRLRSPTATTRPKPGGLEKSIQVETGTDADGVAFATVYVPRTSLAGKYADYIHNRRFQVPGWQDRGIGTKAKGDRAREKFIQRAMDDNAGKFREIYQKAIGKVVDNALK